jgi:hypothetical protein
MSQVIPATGVVALKAMERVEAPGAGASDGQSTGDWLYPVIVSAPTAR